MFKQIPIIITIIFLISLFLPKLVFAESENILYFSYPKDSLSVGEEVEVKVKLNTGSQPINTVSAVIYCTDEMELINFSKENSIFLFWPEEPRHIKDEKTGNHKISFSAGLPNPGFTGRDAEILIIKLRAIKEGELKFNFERTDILANDGKGTKLESYGKDLAFNIKKEGQGFKSETMVYSKTHLNQDYWYNNDSPEFKWILAENIDSVSFVLDEFNNTEPDNLSEGKMNLTGYQGLREGVWYFHIKFFNGENWSDAEHFKIKIDKNPPLPFGIALDNKGDLTNPSPTIYFEARDELSGIEHYEVRIGDKTVGYSPAGSSFKLQNQSPGTYSVAIIARDKAA